MRRLYDVFSNLLAIVIILPFLWLIAGASKTVHLGFIEFFRKVPAGILGWGLTLAIFVLSTLGGIYIYATITTMMSLPFYSPKNFWIVGDFAGKVYYYDNGDPSKGVQNKDIRDDKYYSNYSFKDVPKIETLLLNEKSQVFSLASNYGFMSALVPLIILVSLFFFCWFFCLFLIDGFMAGTMASYDPKLSFILGQKAFWQSLGFSKTTSLGVLICVALSFIYQMSFSLHFKHMAAKNHYLPPLKRNVELRSGMDLKGIIQDVCKSGGKHEAGYYYFLTEFEDIYEVPIYITYRLQVLEENIPFINRLIDISKKHVPLDWKLDDDLRIKPIIDSKFPAL